MSEILTVLGDLQRVRIVDRNARAFDISTVGGAINLVTFLARLAHDHAPLLVKKLEDALAKRDLSTELAEKAEKMKWNLMQKW